MTTASTPDWPAGGHIHSAFGTLDVRVLPGRQLLLSASPYRDLPPAIVEGVPVQISATLDDRKEGRWTITDLNIARPAGGMIPAEVSRRLLAALPPLAASWANVNDPSLFGEADRVESARHRAKLETKLERLLEDQAALGSWIAETRQEIQALTPSPEAAHG